MNKFLMSLSFVLLIVFASCNSDTNPVDQIDTPEGYTLLWADEFDGTEIDPANWIHETGDGTDYDLPAGWGNDEKQLYTLSPSNSAIETDEELSVLAITAREENAGEYTSAKLTTQNLFGMRFGLVEIRAKLPYGQGIWPAIWMLGGNQDLIDWPGCGEIDIVEVLGQEPSKSYSTIHFANGVREHEEIQGVHQLTMGSFSDDYHLFTLEWTPESLIFGVDGMQVLQAPIEDDMKEFLRSFYLILNVAVGGYWPGDPDETTFFPQTMYVDYVRVFSKDDFVPPESPPLIIDDETIGPIIEPNIANNAIRTAFREFGSLSVTTWGGGGQPEILTSGTAVDGDSSLVFDFPGGSWGGAYIEMVEHKDLSQYTNLKFSLNFPEELKDAEIKLESPSTNAAVFLIDYTGTEVSDGFIEYTIPLSDFTGLNLGEMRIPFAIWNPKDVNNNFVAATVLIDNLYFSD